MPPIIANSVLDLQSEYKERLIWQIERRSRQKAESFKLYGLQNWILSDCIIDNQSAETH